MCFFPRLVICGLAASLIAFSQSDGKKPVTLDTFLAHRRMAPITPIWSPDGSAFIYEQNDSVELHSVKDHRTRQWFSIETLAKEAAAPQHPKEYGWQNRRVAADSFQWFPNSRDVLASVNGDLFCVHADGKFEQLTKSDIAEEDPRLSPDGKAVIYRWKSNLYLLDFGSKTPRQLTNDGTPTLLNGQLDWVYPEELDLGQAVWWSPDSKRIAFLQFDVSQEFVYPQVDLTGTRALSEPERYPQAGTPNANVRLGEIAVADGETKWMQVGGSANELLARVAWLPDSSQIAVERLNRVQDQLDLLFCDPGTGATRTVLHESSKTWINVADNLFFLKSQPEFLWTSERSGFRHLYRYSTNGELRGQLTHGDWEVVAITAIDESAKRVFYTSSETSPLETQLYSVPLEGGAATRVTPQAGTHRIHMNEEGSYFVDTYSSLHEPDRTRLVSTADRTETALPGISSDTAPDYALLPEEIATVKAEDGTVLYARLVKPANMQPGKKYPVIVFVYGGPGAQSVRNNWYGLSWEQVLAHRGYVVWQLDNRGSHGRGLAFEAPLYRNLGQQEIADQRVGVNHLLSMGFVDRNRIGIFGYSYGGYMTLRSLLLAGDLFKVGVAGAPVTDWHNYDTIYTERYMGLPDENAKAYEKSANVTYADKLAGKLLIIGNIEDDNVLFQNTLQMATALERAGKPFFMQVYPQKTHGIGGPLRRSFYEEMTSFFDVNLKGAE